MSAPLLTPSERLALSRERLRLAVSAKTGPSAPSAASFLSGNSGVLDVLKTLVPGAAEVVDALAQWWERASLRPLAERHPVGLVAGALVAGMLMAWARPWRWLSRPPWLTTLVPALLTSVLASGQLQSWILSMLAASKPPTDPMPNPDTGTPAYPQHKTPQAE